MDLVEIRKKAKSRKTGEKKGTAREGVTPHGGPGAEEESPVPSDESGGSQEAGPRTESGTGRGTGAKDQGVQAPAEESRRGEGGLKSLSDVLDSQHEEVKEEEEEQLQLLTFQLAGEEYGLNIMDIKEIIRPRETTDVPRAPDYILGIFSLRGTIIPVFDVNLRLGLPRAERGAQNRIVVVKYKEHLFGLHVDSVVQVLDIPLSRIEPPPEILGGIEGEFLRGIGRIDERLIILLNLGSILKQEEGDGSVHPEMPPD